MKKQFKTILTAIRIALDKVANKIPKKLSDLEIDMELGGKSDWNQNDPSASNYVKNRPLYTNLEEHLVIPFEANGTCKDESITDAYIEFVTQHNGEKFTADVNGIKLNVIANVAETSDGNGYLIDLIKDDGNKNGFLTSWDDNCPHANFSFNGIEVTSDVEVKICSGYIKQLDEKYIPNTIVRNTNDALTTTDKTIVGAINEINGKTSGSSASVQIITWEAGD